MGRSQARPDGRGITLQLSGPVRSAGVQTTSRFRADVEGLRAVAVLAVVVYHAGLSQVGGGFVGVDVFYVLSGFLITGLLWEELQTTGRLRMGAFYGRRARRLLPAAVLVLMVTVAASWVWLSPLQARGAARDAAAAAVAALALAGAGSLALSLRLTARSAPWAFFSLPTRAWELAAGGLVALSASALRRLPGVAAATLGWLGLEAIAWSMTRFSAATPFPGIAALFPVGGTAAVLAAGCAAPRLGPGRVLGWWPLQAGGKLSYSWYLWHWPLLVLAPAVAGHPPRVGTEPEPGCRQRPARPGHREAGRGPGAVLILAAGAAAPQPGPGGGADRRCRGRHDGHGRPGPHPSRPGLGRPASRHPHHPATPGPPHQHRGPGRGPAGQPVRPRGPCGRQGGNGGDRAGQPGAVAGVGPRQPATARRRWLPDPLAGCGQRPLCVWVAGCDRWRANMLQRIRAERPALVVLGAARHYGDVYHFQVYGPAWISGLAKLEGSDPCLPGRYVRPMSQVEQGSPSRLGH
jgi:peptidoglycan/LPS O-acetylase OafA/YrhL